MANVINFPMTVIRQRPDNNRDIIDDYLEGTAINGYAMAEFRREFEIACRKAIGRLGEAGAMDVLKDTIISIQGSVS